MHSTDQQDKDRCSKHQRSAYQRLSTSTKIGWSIEQNAIYKCSADQRLSTSTVVDLKTIFHLFFSIDQLLYVFFAFISKNTPQSSLFKMISLLILVYIIIIYQLLKDVFAHIVPFIDTKGLWISLLKQGSAKNLSSTALFEKWYSLTFSVNRCMLNSTGEKIDPCTRKTWSSLAKYVHNADREKVRVPGSAFQCLNNTSNGQKLRSTQARAELFAQ